MLIGLNFRQQNILHKGLRRFSATKVVMQPSRRWDSSTTASLTESEKEKAMEALIFLTEKRDKLILKEGWLQMGNPCEFIITERKLQVQVS
jgi:hypothetical protein